jgi:hypothetical protein
MESLQVLYYTNSNVWKTCEIFKKWLMRWDVNVQRKTRMVLLLFNNSVAHTHFNNFVAHTHFNNSVAHTHLETLKNIYLEFPSLNSTPLVQPIDVEILKNFKT